MKCAYCQKKLEDDWLFCPKCGSAIKASAAKKLSRSFQNEEKDHFAQHDSSLRDQVFEVVVRHALAGAPWREICAGPMLVNDIDPQEVEAEVVRRRGMPATAAAPQKETPPNKPGRLLKFPRPASNKEGAETNPEINKPDSTE